MPEIIISDTSVLIILSNINELDLLQKVYGKIITTAVIAKKFNEPLPQWIEIRDIVNPESQKILETQIDKGEASAIALALETPHSLILLDDYKGRKMAQNLGLKFTGTIGVIIKAKLSGIITSIKPIILKIRQTNFRLSEDIEKQALLAAGE